MLSADNIHSTHYKTNKKHLNDLKLGSCLFWHGYTLVDQWRRVGQPYTTVHFSQNCVLHKLVVLKQVTNQRWYYSLRNKQKTTYKSLLGQTAQSYVDLTKAIL